MARKSKPLKLRGRPITTGRGTYRSGYRAGMATARVQGKQKSKEWARLFKKDYKKDIRWHKKVFGEAKAKQYKFYVRGKIAGFEAYAKKKRR